MNKTEDIGGNGQEYEYRKNTNTAEQQQITEGGNQCSFNDT